MRSNLNISREKNSRIDLKRNWQDPGVPMRRPLPTKSQNGAGAHYLRLSYADRLGQDSQMLVTGP